MASKQATTKTTERINAQPRLRQRAREIQAYGTVSHALPLELEEPVRLEMTEQLNQLLADTMALRDLYKNYSPEKAGGGGSTPSLATKTLTINYLPPFVNP